MTGSRQRIRRAWSLALLACVPLAGCTSILTAVGGGVSEELRANGVSAPAEIQEIWDTGWTINDSPVIGMKVRVLPAGLPAFEATIAKTTVSRIALYQFEPGNVVPVRFDPQDPTVIAVDFEAPAREAASSGNPYRDRFVRIPQAESGLLPPPTEPEIFLGTADSAADTQALFENNYALLGSSTVKGGSDLRQALDMGKEAGAALVVVYGSFAPSPEATLDVLPYRRRPLEPGAPGAAPSSAWRGLFSNLGSDDRFAAYWGKTRPAILGIVFRPLDPREQAQLGSGVVVDAVADGSPAASARIVAGDVIVAIEGKPVADALALPPLLGSLAGRTVRIDLIRNGNPSSVTAQLNPAPP